MRPTLQSVDEPKVGGGPPPRRSLGFRGRYLHHPFPATQAPEEAERKFGATTAPKGPEVHAVAAVVAASWAIAVRGARAAAPTVAVGRRQRHRVGAVLCGRTTAVAMTDALRLLLLLPTGT